MCEINVPRGLSGAKITDANKNNRSIVGNVINFLLLKLYMSQTIQVDSSCAVRPWSLSEAVK